MYIVSASFLFIELKKNIFLILDEGGAGEIELRNRTLIIIEDKTPSSIE